MGRYRLPVLHSSQTEGRCQVSRIKEAWLKVPMYHNPSHAPLYQEDGCWYVYYAKGRIWVGDEQDLRTLAEHGIVRIVEEEEKSCLICWHRHCQQKSQPCESCGNTLQNFMPIPVPASPVCPRCNKAILRTDFTINGKRVWTCDCEEGK
jgi:hypothetical protein